MAAQKKRNTVEYIASPSGLGSDILRPTILKYGQVCFRKTTGHSGGSLPRYGHVTDQDLATELELELEDEPTCQVENDDDTEGSEDIRKLRTGEYELALPVPSVFFKYIIGKGGATKRSIEQGTRCTLIIPKRGEDEAPIVILGANKRQILSAKQRIEILVWSNRNKEGITHFIGIAINKEQQVIEKFEDFKSQVLRDFKDIDEQLFQESFKLHLTLPVLYLFTASAERTAVACIRETIDILKTKLGTPPSLIKLQGLEAMNDDYSSVNVLYSKVSLVDGSPWLQEFADCLQEELMKKLPDNVKELHSNCSNVKLHMTLMNSNYKMEESTDTSDTSKGNRYQLQRKKYSFDARGIFQKFSDFDFRQFKLSEVHLLSIKEPRDSNGFYKCIDSFSLV